MSSGLTTVGGAVLGLSLLTTLLSVAGCSADEGQFHETGGTRSQGSATTERTNTEVQEREMALAGRTKLTLSGPPLAACHLYDPGAPEGADRDRQVMATGSDGLVEFDIEPRPSMTGPGSLTFDCDTADGIRTRSLVTFTGSDAPLEEMHTGPKRVLTGKLRPPLAGDVMSYDQGYLIAHGYPRRPEATSPRFAKWMEAVRTESTIVDSGVVSAPGLRHADHTSNGWCGYAAYNTPGQIMVDSGAHWAVPTLTPNGRGNQYSSVWVGLDGTNGFSDDVILQGGSSQNAADVGFAMIYVRFVWIEYGIHNGTDSTHILSDMPINSGDVLEWDVLSCNSDFSISPTGQYGCFQLVNDTTFDIATKIVSRPQGGVFSGHSAEWIVEAPLVDGQETNLAKFGTVTMTNAHEFIRQAGVDSRYAFAGGGGTYDKIVLEDNPTNHVKLCGPSSTAAETIQFKWYARGTR